MREHLYKARCKDNGEWVEGSLITVDSCHGDDWNGAFILPKVIDESEDFNKAIEVIPETVGQFIGRTDINDKKIFSGDQCFVWESRGADGKLRRKWDRPLTVTYEDYLGKFGFDDRVFKEHWDISKFEAFEVVGNIHDKEAAK